MVISNVADGRARARALPRRIALDSGVLSLSVRTIGRMLWLAAAVIIALGAGREAVIHAIGANTVLKDLRHFALDTEHSLPVWYEATSMAVAAALLAVLAYFSRERDSRNRFAWSFLAVIFLLMSIDELVAIHEVAIVPLRDRFDLSGVLYFSWVVLAAPVLVVLALVFVPFLRRLPLRTAVRFVAAGALFVGGAFGMELVGGHFASSAGFDSAPYKIAATGEESLEIVGLTLFLTSLLRHLVEVAPTFRVALHRDPPGAA